MSMLLLFEMIRLIHLITFYNSGYFYTGFIASPGWIRFDFGNYIHIRSVSIRFLDTGHTCPVTLIEGIYNIDFGETMNISVSLIASEQFFTFSSPKFYKSLRFSGITTNTNGYYGYCTDHIKIYGEISLNSYCTYLSLIPSPTRSSICSGPQKFNIYVLILVFIFYH